jgi:hypothetical protein
LAVVTESRRFEDKRESSASRFRQFFKIFQPKGEPEVLKKDFEIVDRTGAGPETRFVLPAEKDAEFLVRRLGSHMGSIVSCLREVYYNNQTVEGTKPLDQILN